MSFETVRLCTAIIITTLSMAICGWLTIFKQPTLKMIENNIYCQSVKDALTGTTGEAGFTWRPT